MKLSSNNIFILVGISFLGISIMLDMVVMYKKYEIVNQLDTYIEYEDKKLNYDIHLLIKIIENSILFQDEESQIRHQAFRNLSFTNMASIRYNMGKNWYPQDDQKYNFIEYFYLETEFEELSLFENTKIKKHFEKLLNIEIFQKLRHQVWGTEGFDAGGYNIDGIRPITEDSLYLGYFFEPDKRSKVSLHINGEELQEIENHNNNYQIPISDTLRITTNFYWNNFISIDTFTHHQTIANINGEWKYIGSD